MSSTMQSFSNGDTAGRTASPMRSMWGRLLWKDAREVLPIWITLLFSAMLCLSVTVWMVNSDTAHIAPLYISGHTFIALISVITGVFLMASEDENRTLHLLRNLPLPPKHIVWQKMLLGSVGVIALAVFVAIFTMLLAYLPQCHRLEGGSSYRFTLANVTLLPLLYLVIALLSSMVSRSHYYGVLIAGAIAAGAIAILEPTWMGANVGIISGRGATRWLWVAMTVIGGAIALVFNATRWVEERVVRKASAGRLETNTASVSRSTAANLQNPFPVLLWQSFRQSRVLLLCCFGLTIAGWIAIVAFVHFKGPISHPYDPVLAAWLTLLWTLIVMAMFASSIFLDDKRQSNYLFFQQNRERSKWFWLSRLLPFGGLALLLALIWNFKFSIASSFLVLGLTTETVSSRQIELLTSVSQQIGSQSLLVPLMALLGIIGIGQYFSMFVRNPILSFVFTGIVSVVFAALMSYVVVVNESVWLFVLPTIVAGFVATWWRSKSWLATSPYAKNFLMPIVLPVIVFAMVAATFIHHRATEFGDVKLDAQNFVAWNNGHWLSTNYVLSGNRALKRVEFGTEADRQKAATLYREALKLYQGDDWVDGPTYPKRKSAEQTANFVTKNQAAIDKIIEASQLPACVPFLSADSKTRGEEEWALKNMALINSHHQLLKSNLTAAKVSIDAYDRIYQRTDYIVLTNRHTAGYYNFLIDWADHPDQTLDAIQSAIAKLEGSDTDIWPSKIVLADDKVLEPQSPTGLNISRLYWEFGGERGLMNLQEVVANLQQNKHHYLIGLKENYRLFPWEYQRQLKVGQLRAIREFDRNQAFLDTYSVGNDQLITGASFGTFFDQVIGNQYRPHIPIDEDRTWPNVYISAGSQHNVITDAHWRRYTLLRLGLAAYKIEHEKYPDDLLQLKSYYKYGFPKTTRGLMYPWFKDGIGSDLIKASYEDIQFGELKSARKIASGKSPLLLPFSLDPATSLPQPIDYGQGKLGIDINRLYVNQPEFLFYCGHTLYKTSWAVGAKD